MGGSGQSVSTYFHIACVPYSKVASTAAKQSTYSKDEARAHRNGRLE